MLQIAKKTYAGKTIGFVVGYWFYPRRFWSTYKPAMSFRSIREGLIFPTEKQARKWRDKVEEQRRAGAVTFERVEN